MLCDALELDFKTSHPNSDPYKFYIESGRKYHKIIMETNGQIPCVHAFVDKKTGEVYKPASFKAPAKIVRYNLLRLSLVSNALSVQIGREVISMFADTDPTPQTFYLQTNAIPFTEINIDFEDDN